MGENSSPPKNTANKHCFYLRANPINLTKGHNVHIRAMPQKQLHRSLDVEVPAIGLLIRDKFHIIPNQVFIVETKFIVLSCMP